MSNVSSVDLHVSHLHIDHLDVHVRCCVSLIFNHSDRSEAEG